MKKIAFKFLAVIGVLVAISLVSLQMLSMNIRILFHDAAFLIAVLQVCAFGIKRHPASKLL